MNGQTLQKAFVPLPSGGQAVYNSSGLLYYGHPDHLGSTRFASTPSRTMYFDTAYAPFGETYATSGTADLSFTGQRQDTVAGLYDFPAREYSIQGRWPSPDPAGLAAVDPSNPQSWNRYAYVMNNPLNSVDALGLSDCIDGHIGCNCSDPGGDCTNDLYGAPPIDVGPPCCVDTTPPLDLGPAIATTLILQASDFVIQTTSSAFSPDTLDVGYMLNGSWGSYGPLHGGGNSGGQYYYPPMQVEQFGRTVFAQARPTVCGGGVFFYAGFQGEKDIKGMKGEGFLGYLGEWDSNSGWSNNGLFEGGTPKLSGGVAVNKSGAQGLLFVPLTKFGGAVVSPIVLILGIAAIVFGISADRFYPGMTENAKTREIPKWFGRAWFIAGGSAAVGYALFHILRK